MNPEKINVCIAGAGLAGLSAAVFIKNMDSKNLFNIDLLESSPKPGGRTYSFVDSESGFTLDNGQHIIAGWYSATIEYLKICNSISELNFQNNLEINFYDKDKNNFKLNCPDLFSPVNLIFGIFKFDALTFSDKLKFLKVLKLINREAYSKELMEKTDVRTLLTDLKQSDNAIKFFWEPFLLAVFNSRPDDINSEIFINVLKEGFTGKGKSNLLIPEKDLNSLFINNALKFIENNFVNIEYNKRVVGYNKNGKGLFTVETSDGELKIYDVVINAVPFFRLNEIKCNFDFPIPNLKTSSIVSVHLIFEENIPEDTLENNSFGMSGLINTKCQWIFKKNENHLSVVISGADFIEHNNEKIVNMDKDKILDLCISELNNCLKNFDFMKIKYSKVIKEKRATFIPDYSSVNERMKSNLNIENFYLCGDWTETQLPATIESAVRSGKKVSHKILNKFYN